LSGAVAKLASINLWKLVLSPTGLINLGFILREDLLLCSSYLPLGVPYWADIYTPSTAATTHLHLVFLATKSSTISKKATTGLHMRLLGKVHINGSEH
jgi:hypothetical protein